MGVEALAGHAEAIRALHARRAADKAEIGRRLREVKAAIGHGGFTAWVEAECPFTLRTAQNYMGIASPDESEIISLLPDKR